MSSKLRSGWVDAAVGVFAAANVVAIFITPIGETIPFHFVWVSFTLLYGFRAWSARLTALLLTGVVVATGLSLAVALYGTAVGWDELTEVPLMAAMFVVCMVHVERHKAAKREVERLAEREHELLERERTLVQSISHELRTPITIARGHADLLQRSSSDSASDDAGVIVSELTHLGDLAERLLALAASADPSFLRFEDVDVESLLVGTARRWSVTAERCWRVDAGLDLVVKGDEERLRTCLDALVENAVRHTSDNDEVVLSSRLERDVVVITVADTGTGFAPEILPVAFDRFTCGSRRTGNLRGTGLGLPLVKAIVESHGGTVAISSQAGAGTIVSIRLGSSEALGRRDAPSQAVAARVAERRGSVLPV